MTNNTTPTAGRLKLIERLAPGDEFRTHLEGLDDDGLAWMCATELRLHAVALGALLTKAVKWDDDLGAVDEHDIAEVLLRWAEKSEREDNQDWKTGKGNCD